ncbi:MAG: hypothetical protein ABI556_06895 [Gemmatimonadales bacterium]
MTNIMHLFFLLSYGYSLNAGPMQRRDAMFQGVQPSAPPQAPIVKGRLDNLAKPPATAEQIVFPIDLGRIRIKEGNGPDGVSWVKTPNTTGVSGQPDIGWFSFDHSSVLQPGGFSLHYGAQNGLSFRWVADFLQTNSV